MLQDIQITTTPSATDEQAGGCCGGGCCAPAAPSTGDGAVTQSFEVEGMTCGHCVSSVTEEIAGLAGVERVDIELVAGGRSSVTVVSDAPLRLEDVRAAVTEAGYSVAQG